MRRLLGKQRQVHVPVLIEVGGPHLTGGTVPGNVALGRDVMEAAVAVVVEQGVGAVRVGHPQIQVPVVVRVHEGAVHTLPFTGSSSGGIGDVDPAGSGAAKQPVGTMAQQVGVGSAVVVVVAEHGSEGVVHRSERVLGQGGEAAFPVATQDEVVVAPGDEHIQVAVAIQVGHLQGAHGVFGNLWCTGGEGARGAEQWSGRRWSGDDLGLAHGQGLGLGAHARVLELGQVGPRVLGQPLILGDELAGLLHPPQLAQALEGAVIGAAQIGVELDGLAIGGHCALGIAGLRQRLAQVVGGIGIARVGLHHLAKVPGCGGGIPLVQAQQAGYVPGAQVVGVSLQDPFGQGQGLVCVTLLVAVQGGDGQIDDQVGVVWVGLDQGLEDLAGALVVVAAHERHRAVVARNHLRGPLRLSGLSGCSHRLFLDVVGRGGLLVPGAAGEDDRESEQGGQQPNDTGHGRRERSSNGSNRGRVV